ISGTADNGSIHVVQDSTTAGTFQVLDGTTPVNTSPLTGVKNIRLNLTSADDNVAIDLGGQTFSGSVTAHLGGGANQLTVVKGGIGGRLAVTAGDGDDTVTLGDGATALSLKDVDLELFGGTDTVTLASQATVSRTLSTLYANDITLDAGSTAHNVFIR